MKIRLFFFFQILLFKLTIQIYNSGENWAILACGSTGYINYRHQADVFHVYQTLLKRGFSKNHLILFVYDDIAYDKKNPFPGEVYNRPDGPNVYDGVTIDYSDYLVTPENYISVLKGDTQNGKLKKVLNSTKEDNIFLYFSDHGINGAIVFPDNKFLFADELEQTFIYMKQKGLYKNIIYYMESCYSGSMFQDLDPKLNIYSITAASPKEQSMATYCYPDDYVKGREMHTCLSNEFTSNWLDDTDSRLFLSNTIDNYSSREQYLKIKELTKNSNKEEDNKDIKDDDEFDYDEIYRKIQELDDEDDNYDNYEEDDNIVYNSYDIKDIKKIFNNEYHFKKDNNYNYINYIIDRNKFYHNKNPKEKENKNEKKEEIVINNRLKSQNKKLISKCKTNIPSQNVKLYYLQIEKNKNPEKIKEYEKELEETEKSKIIFQLLKLKFSNINNIEQKPKQKIDFKCLRYSIEIFKEKCNLNERDLIFISSLSDICSFEDINLELIKDIIIDICKNIHK